MPNVLSSELAQKAWMLTVSDTLSMPVSQGYVRLTSEHGKRYDFICFRHSCALDSWPTRERRYAENCLAFEHSGCSNSSEIECFFQAPGLLNAGPGDRLREVELSWNFTR